MKIWMILLKLFKCVIWWCYWNTERLSKITAGGFLAALVALLAASLVQPVISPVVKGISGRGVRRVGREYITKFFSPAPSFNEYWDY